MNKQLLFTAEGGYQPMPEGIDFAYGEEEEWSDWQKRHGMEKIYTFDRDGAMESELFAFVQPQYQGYLFCPWFNACGDNSLVWCRTNIDLYEFLRRISQVYVNLGLEAIISELVEISGIRDGRELLKKRIPGIVDGSILTLARALRFDA